MNNTNNFKFDNSYIEFNSPIFKKKFFDKKRNSVMFSPITPKMNFPKKKSKYFETNKNLSRSNNINSLDYLSQDSENKNPNDLSILIPIDT